jgi:hypothetical protein
MPRPDLKLAWCSHSAARYAVEHWHYSGTLPTPPLIKVGVWESERYIGCVLFSRGATPHIGKPYGLKQTEIAELTRIALATHVTPVSRIIRIALSYLRSNSPGLRLLVSYADPSQGHAGGIYQASGWTYVGQSPPTTEYVAPDGKQWHSRMVSKSGINKVYGKNRRVWRIDQCTPVIMPGKHKYLFPLDAAMREQIEPLAKAYPKRQKDSSEPLGHPAERGRGSTDPDAPSDDQAEVIA